MAHDKLARLTAKKDALAQVIHELRLRQRADVKRLRARREVLWGRLVVRWMQQDAALGRQLHERLDGELLGPAQRRLLAGFVPADEAGPEGGSDRSYGHLE